MGDYLEKNGKTRAGKFLQGLKGVAPSILQLAGTITGVDALDDLAKAIKGDNTIAPQDKETALELLKMDLAEMQEVTKRWSSDMISDSWLSKNVRPITLLSLLFFVFVFCFLDLFNTITVAPIWVELFKQLLMVVIVAYFGSRGIEKYKKIGK